MITSRKKTALDFDDIPNPVFQAFSWAWDGIDSPCAKLKLALFGLPFTSPLDRSKNQGPLASLLVLTFPSLYLSNMNLHNLVCSYPWYCSFLFFSTPGDIRLIVKCHPVSWTLPYVNQTDRKLGRCRLVHGSLYSLIFESPPPPNEII